MKQKQVFIISAPPGAGKTSWIKAHLQDKDSRISRDAIRFVLLREEDEYFKHEDKVFKLFINAINSSLEDPEIDRVFVDATHISRASRAKVISKLNRTLISKLNCLQFTTPLEICLARNASREGRARVPDSVIKRMFLQYEEPTLEEGFDNIYKVNEKGEIE